MADMRMAVDETRGDVRVRGIEDLRRAPVRMPCVRADIANSPIENSHLDAVQNLAGIDVNEFTTGNDQIGFDLAHGAAKESSKRLFRASHDRVFSTKKQLAKTVSARHHSFDPRLVQWT